MCQVIFKGHLEVSFIRRINITNPRDKFRLTDFRQFVNYVFTSFNPAFISSTSFLSLGQPQLLVSLRSNVNPHSLMIKRCILREVDDVKLYTPFKTVFIAHIEKEPLVMSAGVRVNAHVEIIFIIFYLNDHIQITAFK